MKALAFLLSLIVATPAMAQQANWLWWGTNSNTAVPVSASNPLPVTGGGVACSGCTAGTVVGYNGSALVNTPLTFTGSNVTLSGASGELFTVNANNGALAVGPAGTLLHFANADGVSTRALFDSFANQSAFGARRADGTRASPTAIQSGESIFSINGFGYGATGYSGSRVSILLAADQNWTDSAQGARIDFSTTPDNTAAPVNNMRLQASGGLTLGSGIISTDPGAGNLLAAGTVQGAGTILTAAAPTVAANQIGFGGTVAATGNCGTLAGDAGCIVINVAGTTRYIPYY